MAGWFLVGLWICSSAVSAIATLRLLRRFDDHWSVSLFISSIAAAPGWLLLLETAVRNITCAVSDSRPVLPYDYSTILLAVLWVLIGPLLVVAGFRAESPVPVRVRLVQLGHVLSWGTSSLMALWFASGV